MKSESQKALVRRITIDEKLSNDLIRFLFCSLKEGIERFADLDEQWGEEQEVLAQSHDYAQMLDVTSEALPWETLKEGQVFLSGEFEVIGDRTAPEYFKVSPGRKEFLRIDNLKEFKEEVKYLYSEVLKRR